MRCSSFLSVAAMVLASHSDALAEGPPAPEGAPAGTAEAPAQAPAPYAAPFGLRGVGAATAIRGETAYGLNAGTSSTVVQYLIASYAVVPEVSLYARGGWVDYIPSVGNSSTAFTNVTIGALWATKLSSTLRLATTLSSGLPVGQGGGDSPDPGAAAAIAAGNLARSRMEGSSTFSPNDLAPFVAADLAYVSGGLTLQAEVNVFELIRVRGSNADPDATKTVISGGVAAGYFIVPELSLGVEARDAAYVSTPVAVDAGKVSRMWITVGGGPRVHLHLGETIWFRPGLAYIQPLNDPAPNISAASYHIVQLDLPLVF
jgi:hypothetical protein